jgi:hypothetical protein
MSQWLSSSVSEDLLEMMKLFWVGDVQHGCSGSELAWVQAVALLLRACADGLRHSWVLSLPSFEVRLGEVAVSGVLGFGVNVGKEACRARFGAAAAVLLT